MKPSTTRETDRTDLSESWFAEINQQNPYWSKWKDNKRRTSIVIISPGESLYFFHSHHSQTCICFPFTSVHQRQGKLSKKVEWRSKSMMYWTLWKIMVWVLYVSIFASLLSYSTQDDKESNSVVARQPLPRKILNEQERKTLQRLWHQESREG